MYEMVNIFLKQLDKTSAATTTRDIQALCKSVNDFVKNPSVLISRTEMRTTIDTSNNITLVIKIDYDAKSTGG